ncbi:MAG: GNAT family N-acetyltransferase [Paludibacter sp.]|nr:GNAT family N-acetyltransferase [Paludibacter sp.]
MHIDFQKIVLKKISETEIDEMVSHRIDYLTEMQGKQELSAIHQLHCELRKYFSTNIKNKHIIALVAYSESKAVSYGAIVLRTIPGDFAAPSYLEGDIINMYTIPEARKQGVSTVVLNALISEARQVGVSKLALHTTIAGEKLYRKAGFADPVFPYLEMVL